MIVYITDNLLKVNRVLPGQIDSGSSEDLPSLRSPGKGVSINLSLKALLAAKIDFILDLKRGEQLPKYGAWKPSPDCATWHVPEYTLSDRTTYEVELSSAASGVQKFEYHENINEQQIENMILCGLSITRVLRANGSAPTKSFLAKFGMKRKRDGGIQYAVPVPVAVKAKVAITDV